MSAVTRIGVSEPSLGDREARYLNECLEENWIASRGRFVGEFEALFAGIHGCVDAVSTVNGTAALHLAMIEIGVGPGDEVLVPALTFVATANAVQYVGATPVFVDVDPVSYTLDPRDAERKITQRTRALIAVHLFGHPADMDPICELARGHGLAVVEDAAQALGSYYRDRRCGAIGDIGCFSFNGNKIITAGGGGMVLSADPRRLEHIRHLSLQAREPGNVEYLHDEVGFNYALSNMHAAIGLAQLERLDDLLARRRALASRYAAALESVEGLTFSGEAPWANANFWLMSVLIDRARYGRSRGELMEALDHVGIDSRPFFVPLPDLRGHQQEAEVPVARCLHAGGLILPSSSGLEEVDQDRVLGELLAVHRRA